MQPLRSLPTRLVTCPPPWCQDEYSEAPTSYSPEPFQLRFHHVRSRDTSLWDALHNLAELNDRGVQDRILPICREIYTAYHSEAGDEQFYGVPVKLLRKFGEISLRVLHRVWDLHLAYTTTPHISGHEPGYGPGLFSDSFYATMRDVVLKRLHTRLCRAQLERALAA